MTALVGGAYAVSAGLVVYGIQSKIIASSEHFTFLVVEAAAGLGLAVLAILKK